jgi:hypothetical protein
MIPVLTVLTTEEVWSVRPRRHREEPNRRPGQRCRWSDADRVSWNR